ncbi:uncharacterized protein FIBRA_08058 [Fibroporia radiculosa]|uniref:NAD(P)-binding domain-containing protein n=1 Tax=Fibroporia radiculosa TaxID=599839 RepID=J4H4Z0_9APHY|nr:uncharacterized protein FIBRA_08058 [Fibroporia radiculosa]CCM05824.1 predicted protein [Fibroporia radiculosa]
MSASKVAISLTGATGYIGGSVLTRLLHHPSAATFDITVFVRSAEKAKLLEKKFGVKAVVGTHADSDKLEALAEQSHVVFSCADADNLPAMQAILRGLRKRHTATGDVPILIHTSGSGTVCEMAGGMFASETVYSDMNVDQIKSIPPTAPHRALDLAIVDADIQGYARTYIILPSIIYGIASGPLIDAGISNPFSMGIPIAVRIAFARGQVGMIGTGKNSWPNVHIDDLTDLYIGIFDAVMKDRESIGHGWEGFYFGENGEQPWYDVYKAIAQALVELGIGKSGEPTTYTTEEVIKYMRSAGVGDYMGANSRCRADRGRSIGWKPSRTSEDMLKSIKPEVEILWKKKLQDGA